MIFRNIRVLVVGVGVVLLAACAPQYEKQVQLVEPLSLSGQQCVKNCFEMKQYCEQRTASGLVGCKDAAHRRAVVELREYDLANKDNSEKTKKTAADFYDESQCYQAVPCNKVYFQCFAHCGGSVKVIQKCVKNCPKPEQQDSSKASGS